MSEETKTNLRNANATLEVAGILAEKNLEATRDTNGHGVIRGYLALKTDDVNFVTLNVYVGELTTKGEPNRAYSGMQTVMNEYQSIAEVGEEAATRVYCKSAQVVPNSYIGKEDKMIHENVRYSASFLSRVAPDKFTPKAEMKVEAYLSSLGEEVNKEGEPTGRLKMKTYVPTYKGVEPFEVVVPVEYADAMQSTVEPGQTIQVWAKPVNRTEVIEKTIQLVIGGTRTETKTNRVSEIVLTGLDGPYDDESLVFDAGAIKQGLVERDLRLQKEKDEMANSKAAKPAAAQGRTLPKFTNNFANM